ncbi:MAG: hypothetical protein ACI86M_004014 [Saprospiraceae bacterium]|jgi:hypothetical protein
MTKNLNSSLLVAPYVIITVPLLFKPSHFLLIFHVSKLTSIILTNNEVEFVVLLVTGTNGQIGQVLTK